MASLHNQIENINDFPDKNCFKLLTMCEWSVCPKMFWISFKIISSDAIWVWDM